jgi:hypothetical protein
MLITFLHACLLCLPTCNALVHVQHVVHCGLKVRGGVVALADEAAVPAASSDTSTPALVLNAPSVMRLTLHTLRPADENQTISAAWFLLAVQGECLQAVPPGLLQLQFRSAINTRHPSLAPHLLGAVIQWLVHVHH